MQSPADWSPIVTTDLALRAPTDDDQPTLTELHSDPQTFMYHPLPPELAATVVTRRYEGSVAHWREHGFGYWIATELRDPTRAVGIGGVQFRTFHGRTCLSLYYRFAPSTWGHGYATQTARAAVELATRHLPDYPIVALTVPANEPSQRVALKAGLTHLSELDTEQETHGRRFTHVYYVANW
ncbi:MAG: GNAT family N-acetyltransferase [Bowdeniella nasicola]|nr:GNAT family N-acetyltransferase [Bowdeniella nasicola]